MTEKHRTFLAVSVTAVLALLYGYGTLAPRNPFPETTWLPDTDKYEHAIGTALLAAPMLLVFPRWRLLTVCAAIVFGGLIEIAQGVVGRDAGLFDWAADIAGVSVLAVAISLLGARKSTTEMEVP